MPADIKAKEYLWYFDTPNEEDREVRIRWVPEGKFLSSMTMGNMTLELREKGTEEWVERKFDHGNTAQMPWVVAQNYARGTGMTVEVTVHE